jgi:protein-tyrosine phosphatase
MPEPVKVLFVCLGNICRSPLAEAVFRDLVVRAGLAERFHVESAGTASYHAGELPDPRTRAVAERRGIRLESRARAIRRQDLATFDYILAMDADNLAGVRRLADASGPGAEVHLLREFDPQAGGDLAVPDPYYGGVGGFEHVQEVVERACAGLLEHIRAQRAL